MPTFKAIFHPLFRLKWSLNTKELNITIKKTSLYNPLVIIAFMQIQDNVFYMKRIKKFKFFCSPKKFISALNFFYVTHAQDPIYSKHAIILVEFVGIAFKIHSLFDGVTNINTHTHTLTRTHNNTHTLTHSFFIFFCVLCVCVFFWLI